jgi:hypothetical protein
LEHGQVEDIGLKINDSLLGSTIKTFLKIHSGSDIFNLLLVFSYAGIKGIHVFVQYYQRGSGDKHVASNIEFFFEFEKNMHIIFIGIVVGTISNTEGVIVFRA